MTGEVSPPGGRPATLDEFRAYDAEPCAVLDDIGRLAASKAAPDVDIPLGTWTNRWWGRDGDSDLYIETAYTVVLRPGGALRMNRTEVTTHSGPGLPTVPSVSSGVERVSQSDLLRAFDFRVSANLGTGAPPSKRQDAIEYAESATALWYFRSGTVTITRTHAKGYGLLARLRAIGPEDAAAERKRLDAEAAARRRESEERARASREADAAAARRRRRGRVLGVLAGIFLIFPLPGCIAVAVGAGVGIQLAGPAAGPVVGVAAMAATLAVAIWIGIRVAGGGKREGGS